MAKNIKCKEGKIRYDIKNNKIKHYKLHNKMYRVHKNDFQNYIQEHIEEVQDCLKLQEAADRLNMSKASLGYYVRKNAFPNALDRKSNTSELQSRGHLVCRLLLEEKKQTT